MISIVKARVDAGGCELILKITPSILEYNRVIGAIFLFKLSKYF
jgi:hypothetical protein